MEGAKVTNRVLVWVAAAGASLLLGCGDGTNVNKIWGGSDEASDSKLLEARAAYDRGDFDDAETLALDVYDRNSDNEEAAVLLGYIYLSQGGIDPYVLARALIKDDDEEAASLQDDTDQDEDKNSAGSLLTELGKILNLSDAEKDALREDVYPGSSDVFEDAEVYVPVPITDEVREKVGILSYMNKAVKIICRFVDDDVKVPDEARHNADDCERSDGPHNLPGKAHFLWAFAHLGETLVYQSTLLYSSQPSDTSNFQAAAKNLDTSSGSLSEFTERVVDMKSAVDQVFDTDDENSMVATTLRDIDAVNRAFGAIAGLPDKITKKISEMMEKIETVGKKVGTDGEPTGNTKALKGQLTEKFAKVVGEKIDKALSNPDFVPEGVDYEDLPADKKAEVDEVCDAYDALTVGVPEDKVKRPEGCPDAE